MKPTVGSAQVKSPNHVGGLNPRFFRTLFTGPKTGLRIHAHTTPISTPGMMYGRNSPAWNHRAPLSRIWCVKAAGMIPSSAGSST